MLLFFLRFSPLCVAQWERESETAAEVRRARICGRVAMGFCCLFPAGFYCPPLRGGAICQPVVEPGTLIRFCPYSRQYTPIPHHLPGGASERASAEFAGLLGLKKCNNHTSYGLKLPQFVSLANFFASPHRRMLPAHTHTHTGATSHIENPCHGVSIVVSLAPMRPADCTNAARIRCHFTVLRFLVAW